MVKGLGSLDIHYLVGELRCLEGSRLTNVYQRGSSFTFEFRGEEKRFLRLELPTHSFISVEKGIVPKQPPQFCQALRKHLKGGFLRGVEQLGFERIIRLVFEKRGELFLIAELFSRGNLVLCNGEGRIVLPLKPQRWSSRVVRGGVPYQPPPKSVDPRALKVEELEELAGSTKMDSLVKFLAKDLSLGQVYAEEACSRLGVGKDSGLDVVDKEELLRVVQGLFEESLKPNIVGAPVPFVLKTRQPERFFNTFSEAIQEFFNQARNEESGGELDALKRVVEEQEARVEELKREVEENEAKARLIYEHYQELKELVEDARKKGLKKLVLEVSDGEVKVAEQPGTGSS